jgi:hypothetical protein
MKVLFSINIFTFILFVLLNSFLYFKGYVTFNLLLLTVELFSCLYLFIFTKKVYVNRLVFFWIFIFIFNTTFINGYWEIGALINLIVLICYSFLLINSSFYYNKEKLLGKMFFMSVFGFLLYFLISEFLRGGIYFYKNLYYNIGTKVGSFSILDSSLTVPLLFIVLLFSIGFIKSKIYKYSIIFFVFFSLILLERRGPLIIAGVYLLLYIFDIRAKIVYKIFLYLPLLITIGFSVFIDKIKQILLLIDVIKNRGVDASNEERTGLLIHFFEDLNKFSVYDFLTGHIESFKNIHPDIVYYHPHNTIITILFLSGIIPVIFYIWIHNKLMNSLVKNKLYNQLRMLLTFYLLGYTESILNNFSLFTILFVALIYYYFRKTYNFTN